MNVYCILTTILRPASLAPNPQIDDDDLEAAKSLAEAENWPVSGERGPQHTASGQRRRPISPW